MNRLYPRVLLVNGGSINRHDAAGMTMGNLFRGWPQERIAQIYCDNSEPDHTVCAQSWHLEVEDVPMPRWLRHRAALYRGAHQVAPRGAVTGEAEWGQARLLSRRWVGCASKTAFLRYARYAPYSVPPGIRSWVARFRPDVIYSSLEDRRIVAVALDFAHRLSVPLVPHVMDDWLTTAAAPPSGRLAKWARRDLDRKALRVLRDAPVRLVIGEYMADAYHRRYGGQFLSFANCVDLDERPVINMGVEAKGAFRFGFTGRLLFGRGHALLDVVDALEALNEEGMISQLVIYQQEPGVTLMDSILRSPLVRLADAREEALLQTADGEIDAFLHVDTFDETAAKYLRFSISAKVPWYLAAGVPLFAYGAGQLGTMRFLREQRCAALVDRRDRQLLRVRLRGFMRDGVVRQTLGARARAVACEHFDAREQREAFRRVLVRACCPRRTTSASPE